MEKQRVGRPDEEKAVTFRLPHALVRRLAARAIKEDRKQVALVRAALEAYLAS